MTRNAWVGGFVAGGVLLFAVGLFVIGDRRLLFTPRFELYTTLGTVSGIQVGTKVRVAGLDAGEVLDIDIPSQPSEDFRIRMRLREDVRPLVRRDAVCTVQTDGFVGNAFIQVGRGTDASPIVSDGDTLAGRDPVAIADLIAEGRDTFRLIAAEIAGVDEQIGEAVSGLTDLTQSATSMIEDVGEQVGLITRSSARFVDETNAVMADVRGISNDLRAGRGSLGRLITDDTLYQRWVSVSNEVNQAVADVRATTLRTRELVEGLGASDGAAQQIVQSLRDTLADSREVISDLSEGTEALKHNFLFRGFFRDRGFFDLDSISRDAYLAGALGANDRTALRIWIDAEGLFTRGPDGHEVLTEAGRRRIDSAMADFVRYPNDSPLVVEGYADGSEGEPAYLVSSDRAQAVRDYLLTRFRRRATLTGIMPLSNEAPGSPRGDGHWSGVALALFVRNAALSSR
jgi:phospholipid/cholesterol/gamma-HCH transport system substrate-binding protein